MDDNRYGYSYRFVFDDHEYCLSTSSDISCVDAWNAIGKFICECVDQSKVSFVTYGSVSRKECCLDG